MSVPSQNDLNVTKHLWQGSNVKTINATLGLNSTPSSLTMTLYDSEVAGESFTKPSVGTNTSVKVGNLEFYGLLMDWQKTGGISGESYNVNLYDARELMRHVVLVLENNDGMVMRELIRQAISDELSSTYPSGGDDFDSELNDILSKYEQLFPGISFTNYPLQIVYVGSKWWANIKAKLNNVTVYVNQTQMKFNFADADWPSNLIYDYFEVNADSITLTDLLDDLGRRCGFDWYIDSTADYSSGETISVRNIDRRNAPTKLSVTQTSDGYSISPSGVISGHIESFNEGEAFTNEGTNLVLFGGRRRDIIGLNVLDHLYNVLCPNQIGRVIPDTSSGVSEILHDTTFKNLLEEETQESARNFLNRYGINLSNLTSSGDQDFYNNLRGYYIPSMNELQAALTSEETWIQQVMKNNDFFQSAFPISYELFQATGAATIKIGMLLGAMNATIMPVPKTYKEYKLMDEDDKAANPGYYYWIFAYDKDTNTTTLYKSQSKPTGKQMTNFSLPSDSVLVGSTSGFYASTDISKASNRFVLSESDVSALMTRDEPILHSLYLAVKSIAEQYGNTAFVFDQSEQPTGGLDIGTFFNSTFWGGFNNKRSTITLRQDVRNKKLIRDSGWWRKSTPSSKYSMSDDTVEWLVGYEPKNTNGYNSELSNAVYQYFEDGSGKVQPICLYKDVNLGLINDIQFDNTFIADINEDRSVDYRKIEFDVPTPPSDEFASYYTWDRDYLFIIEVGSNPKDRDKRMVIWYGARKSPDSYSDENIKRDVTHMPLTVAYVADLNDFQKGWTKFDEYHDYVLDGTTDVDDQHKVLSIKRRRFTPKKKSLLTENVTYYGNVFSKCTVDAPYYVLLIEQPLFLDTGTDSNVKFADLFETASGLSAGDISRFNVRGETSNTQGIQSDSRKRKISDDAIMKIVASFSRSVNMSLVPDKVYLPVELPTRYGPYLTSGMGTQPNGSVDYVVDDGFVPDNYGGETALSVAMQNKVNSVGFQSKVQYTYSISATGEPEISLGDKISPSATNSNITSINISRGMDGVKTTYNIESRRRNYSPFSDTTTNKRNVISGLLTEQERKTRMIKMNQEFNRIKKRIKENRKDTQVAIAEQYNRELDLLFGVKTGIMAKKI